MIIKKDENFWGGTNTRVFLPLTSFWFFLLIPFFFILFSYTRETDGLHLLANSSFFLFGQIRASLENLTANWRFGLKYLCSKWLRLLEWLLYCGPQQKLLYKRTELERQSLNHWGSEWTYFAEHYVVFVISGFTREGKENCTSLAYYAACSGNSLPTFRDNLLVPSSKVKNQFLTFEDGTGRLSRNVGKELPLHAA